jgi:hypothetical protein
VRDGFRATKRDRRVMNWRQLLDDLGAAAILAATLVAMSF